MIIIQTHGDKSWKTGTFIHKYSVIFGLIMKITVFGNDTDTWPKYSTINDDEPLVCNTHSFLESKNLLEAITDFTIGGESRGNPFAHPLFSGYSEHQTSGGRSGKK